MSLALHFPRIVSTKLPVLGDPFGSWIVTKLQIGIPLVTMRATDGPHHFGLILLRGRRLLGLRLYLASYLRCISIGRMQESQPRRYGRFLRQGTASCTWV